MKTSRTSPPTSTYQLKRWRRPDKLGFWFLISALWSLNLFLQSLSTKPKETNDHKPETRKQKLETFMRVIGVDPRSEITGYGVIDSGGRSYRVIQYAGIRAPA